MVSMSIAPCHSGKRIIREYRPFDNAERGRVCLSDPMVRSIIAMTDPPGLNTPR